MFNDKVILVTGGTGSFGKKFVEVALNNYSPKKLIVFSRDELKQFEMNSIFPESKYGNIRYFIGDVRDKERLYRAFDGVDFVVHAAALKQVPASEYNPTEAIKTNVDGAMNVINAAIDMNVKNVIALSTDKAVNPINLYGATKLCSDKLFISANNYAGKHGTKFSVVRYGNVMGSRGSVIPFFQKLKSTGVIPITNPQMTRFWISLEQGVDFVLKNFERMKGGEIFVPKIPSMSILDLAKSIAPDCEYKIIGTRPGEKVHEVMITEDDAVNTVEFQDYFVIYPSYHNWDPIGSFIDGQTKRCPEGFRYSSDNNDKWITINEMKELIKHC